MKNKDNRIFIISTVVHMISIGLIVIKLSGGLSELSWIVVCIPFILDVSIIIIFFVALSVIHNIHK